MAEYISREDVIKKIAEVWDKATTGIEDVAYYRAIKIIREMPPADIHPMKRGRWIIADDVEHFIAVCSECGRTEDSRDIKDMPYCHCGAKMDGDING